ncbi:MAG: hypothetical protein JWM93_3217 [Frankiales bacterium]|nr:hypothetical protein [Frankiales bacterium]
MRQGTYSIVARDPDTGEFGAAVQSHWFSVGSLCIWARPGVGAVATQSIVVPAHGPNALDRLEAGDNAATALSVVLAVDDARALRQVAVVGAHGVPAVHTGDDCIAHAGHVVGDTWSCQANMMERDTVPAAMSAAFARTAGPLAERMLAALEAAEAEGGDVRGRQSAAMLVVPATGEPWRASVDLRVDDSTEPLRELRRLHGLHRAYELAGEGDDLLAAGRTADAGDRYRAAQSLAPESDELLFWAGLAMAQSGEFEDGVDAVRRAVAVHPNWLVLLGRLSPEMAPAAAEVLRALQ